MSQKEDLNTFHLSDAIISYFIGKKVEELTNYNSNFIIIDNFRVSRTCTPGVSNFIVVSVLFDLGQLFT